MAGVDEGQIQTEMSQTEKELISTPLNKNLGLTRQDKTLSSQTANRSTPTTHHQEKKIQKKTKRLPQSQIAKMLMKYEEKDAEEMIPTNLIKVIIHLAKDKKHNNQGLIRSYAEKMEVKLINQEAQMEKINSELSEYKNQEAETEEEEVKQINKQKSGRIPPLQGELLEIYDASKVEDQTIEHILDQFERHQRRHEGASRAQASKYGEELLNRIRQLQDNNNKMQEIISKEKTKRKNFKEEMYNLKNRRLCRSFDGNSQIEETEEREKMVFHQDQGQIVGLQRQNDILENIQEITEVPETQQSLETQEERANRLKNLDIQNKKMKAEIRKQE